MTGWLIWWKIASINMDDDWEILVGEKNYPCWDDYSIPKTEWKVIFSIHVPVSTQQNFTTSNISNNVHDMNIYI